ncbi:hypothetical protein Ciccas_014440 [Cichlidogyrus casuarinus]|uniref:Uncharacterized protein n=1 Tax=Cichlidogyrus casuarinus TaxID=1844966 RepID=A0ABD2PI93_9PLAT
MNKYFLFFFLVVPILSCNRVCVELPFSYRSGNQTDVSMKHHHGATDKPEPTNGLVDEDPEVPDKVYEKLIGNIDMSKVVDSQSQSNNTRPHDKPRPSVMPNMKLRTHKRHLNGKPKHHEATHMKLRTHRPHPTGMPNHHNGTHRPHPTGMPNHHNGTHRPHPTGMPKTTKMLIQPVV